jgi:plastocyanin
MAGTTEEQDVTGRCRVAVGALVVLLALPAAAQARTKSVNLGIPPSANKQFEKLQLPLDVNDFFPHGITINRGDKIRFLPVGFHSFDFPARGGDMLPLIAPTGEKVSGVNDAAGSPFWFNGQDQVGFNQALLPPGTFGKKLSYNGSKRVASGLPLAEKLKPVTVTFKKTGRFTYYCNIHAGMKGTVTVKPKGKKVPSKRADAKAIKRQVAASIKTAKALPKTTPPANTVNVGVAGKGGEELFAFVPSTMTVPTGTTLNFRMSPGSYDVHTATTGPGKPDAEDGDPNSYLGQIAASFQSPVFDPRAVYPSEQPPAIATLTPALHGNGFWNSAVMDTAAGTPLPASNSVTFGAPGSYDFYCMIHPFMKATVKVQ